MVTIVVLHHKPMKLFKPLTPRVIAWSSVANWYIYIYIKILNLVYFQSAWYINF